MIIENLIILLSVWLLMSLFVVYLWFVNRRKFDFKKNSVLAPKYVCEKHLDNPLLTPREDRDWEYHGTFNPAAIMDDDGHVHLLYRSISADGQSRVGHARLISETKIYKRSKFPIFHGDDPVSEESTSVKIAPTFDPSIYTSGGSSSGIEDPRAVVIGNRVYMTYTDFAGWHSVRIGLTSISMEDLKAEKWNWKKPQFISPKGKVNKNWILFPEKIRGKYAILHSLSPQILVDYTDDLDNFRLQDGSTTIDSKPPKGGRPGHWDNWVRGAGPPPLKTSLGWLVLYHAMDKKDPNKYKLGGMILDLQNPEKILYRSPSPILEPEFHYENNSKPGVVYASGAIIKNGQLYIYYGGGDRHVCVAQTSLDGLLEWLVKYGKQ